MRWRRSIIFAAERPFKELQARLSVPPKGIFKSIDHILEALEQVKEFPSNQQLALTQPFVTHQNPQLRLASDAIFSAALEKVGGESLEFLEAWPVYSWPVGCANSQFKKRHLRSYSIQTDRNFYRLATRLPDGFVREQALISLSESPQTLDWPFVLEAINDWVHQVYLAAHATAERMVEAGLAEEAMRWQPALADLEGKTRRDTHVFINSLLSRLIGSGYLLTHWAQIHYTLRRMAANILLLLEGADEKWLDCLDAENDAKIIQRLATFYQEHPQYFRSESIQRWARHPNPAIRVIGMEASLQSESAPAIWTLFDQAAKVRSVAQFFARKRGIDLRQAYLDRLTTGPVTSGVIDGLTETGSAADAALVEPFFKSPITRIRLAATKCLLHFEADSHLGEMIRDRSGRIRRLAIDYARNHFEAFDLEARITLFQSPERGPRYAGADLLMSLSKWKALAWILLIITSEDERLAERGRFRLDAWLRSPSPIPSQEILRQALDAFSTARDHIKEEPRNDLETILNWAKEHAR